MFHQASALEELRKAVELAPDQARYAYVYAVGLHSSGRGSDAMTVLKDNLTRHPGDRDTLLALVSFSRDAGDFATALEYAEQLAKIEPTNRDLADVIQDLRRQASKPAHNEVQWRSDPRHSDFKGRTVDSSPAHC
jgi:Flp pilus assembly protein TadD